MQITNVSKVEYPASRFIGKRYTDADRGENGSFGSKWHEWFNNGWFETLEKLGGLAEAGDAYIGLCRCTGNFEYWVGMFFPAGTDVPEGYDSIDMPPAHYGVCWLYGQENTGELFGKDAHERSIAALIEHGMTPKAEGSLTFELYNCPRFTTPDESGNVILDYLVELI